MKHLPLPAHLEQTLYDLPGYIVAAMSAGAGAALAMADVAWRAITGQIPTPGEAGQWSFYGVLIIAIIVLFSSLASVIWWIGSKGLKAFQDLTSALEKLNETTEKQVEYFDDIAKQAMRNALTVPPSKQ